MIGLLYFYCVQMTRSIRDVTCVEEEVFVSQLEAEIPEFRHLKQRRMFLNQLSHCVCGEQCVGCVVTYSVLLSSTEKPAQRPRRQTVEVFGGAITVSYKAVLMSK